MSFHEHRCFELHCDGGCDGNGWDEGPPHFTSRVEALNYAEQYGWTLRDGQALCSSCSRKWECADRGHEWDSWCDRSRMGVVYRQRFCEHCGDDETDPPFDVLCDQAAAVRDAEDVLRAVQP